MSDARVILAAALKDALTRHVPEAADLDVVVERPKQAGHGDYASNVALIAAKRTRRNPRELAQALSMCAPQTLPGDFLDRIEQAGPGFINFRLTAAARQAVVRDILAAGERYGHG